MAPLPSNATNTYASNLYKFDVSTVATPSQLAIDLRAFGTSGSAAGVSAKIWNNATSQFENLASLANTATSMPSSNSTQTLSSNIANYIDGSKKVQILVYTTNSSTWAANAVLNVDQIKLNVTSASPKIGAQRLITAKPSVLVGGDSWFSGVRSIRSQTTNGTNTGTGIATTASGSYIPNAVSRFPTPFVLGSVGSQVQSFSLFNPYNVTVSNLDIAASTTASGVFFSTGGSTWSSGSLSVSGFSISTGSIYVKTTSAISSGLLSVGYNLTES